jgi:hypothetical protein
MINVNLLYYFEFWLQPLLNSKHQKKKKKVIRICNYNEIVYLIICNFDFQYKPKGTIMINIM